MTEQEKTLFTKNLLAWYPKEKRDLPWRKTTDAYAIWISEIMLQQTRVEAVLPYYERFLKAFPTLKDLAKAKEDLILKLWEGLGYYSRARNLQKCAQQLIKEGKTTLPKSEKELLQLPGIGEYTAAAIASIAHQEKTPAIDGNVLRVMTRVLKDDSDITKQATKRKYKKMLADMMGEDPASFTQALMEVGALVCLPNGLPLCDSCPLQKLCASYQDHTMLDYPVKPLKKERKIEKKTVFLVICSNCILLHKRPSTGLLASLYEYPNQEGHLSREEAFAFWQKQGYQIKSIQALPSAKHIFSHLEWHMIGYMLEVERTREGLWVKKEGLFKNYSIPSAFQTYSNILKKK